MLQAMYSGVSGIQAHQTRMNVIGNNISNVNTVGYKASRVSFQDQLSQTLAAASGPNDQTGGMNPTQVGLGVTLGAIDSIQTQGNLQSTGKSTDLAVEGGGFFMVATGSGISYTRDGSFQLDSTGSLVHTQTGNRLLGYQADSFGNIDTTTPIMNDSSLQIPLGMLTDARQTGHITVTGNLNAASAIYSTRADFSGNLDSGAAADSIVKSTTTVYDNLGNAHTVETVFKNPADGPLATPPAPAGATRAWDVVISVDNTAVYDSAAGKSRLYQVGGSWQFADTASGAALGGTLTLDGAAGANHGPQVPGTNGAPAFSLDLNYGTLTDSAAASSVTGFADGQTGASPYWGSAVRVYDSLGVSHLVNFKYTRVPLGDNAPVGATARWDWTAVENGQAVGSSTTTGNTPLYFGTGGRIVAGASQSLLITPIDGSVSPYTIQVDNTSMTQLASDYTASVGSQDGYPVGTLESFRIGADGTITGLFSSGQSRALGQIALASFTNPAGLEKAGENMLRESVNSGSAQIGAPNQFGRGKVTPGFLEMSNVDLSTEFTNMIVTERGFQANTRIISVVDGLLQDVINLKR